MPTVSIVMNCLNGEKYLREAIDSVFAQTYKDWEIIFWDNNSTDRSAETAKSYSHTGKIQYFKSPVTYTLGKTRNLAIQNSSGKFIAFLDVDDLWLPQKLEKQVTLFADDRVGLVFCDTYFFNEKKIIKQIYKNNKPPRGMIFRELLTDYFLSMETVVIRKEALLGLEQWFDERFNVAEEADLFIRISHDWKLDYIDEPLSKWRVHGSSWTWTRTELFTIEKEMMLNKYSDIYANFNEDFKKEISFMRANIAYEYALLDWKNARPGKSRERLRPYLSSRVKFSIIYLLSFFSYSIYKKILRIFKQWIPQH